MATKQTPAEPNVPILIRTIEHEGVKVNIHYTPSSYDTGSFWARKGDFDFIDDTETKLIAQIRSHISSRGIRYTWTPIIKVSRAVSHYSIPECRNVSSNFVIQRSHVACHVGGYVIEAKWEDTGARRSFIRPGGLEGIKFRPDGTAILPVQPTPSGSIVLYTPETWDILNERFTRLQAALTLIARGELFELTGVIVDAAFPGTVV